MTPLINYTTDAANGTYEFLSKDLPAAIVIDIASDYADADEIQAYYVGADNIRKTPVLDADGNPFVISATNKVLPIYFPCKIRIEKAASTAAIGVNLCGWI